MFIESPRKAPNRKTISEAPTRTLSKGALWALCKSETRPPGRTRRDPAIGIPGRRSDLALGSSHMAGSGSVRAAPAAPRGAAPEGSIWTVGPAPPRRPFEVKCKRWVLGSEAPSC